MAALHAVFEDRRRAVLAEIVYVDAAADESAAFVEGDLPESRIGRADFEQAEPRPAGRVDGVGQKGRGDALPLAVGHDGDVHDLGREGPRVDQHVLSDDPAVVAGGVARSAADVVGHRGFDLVGQQQQFPRRGFGFANFHIRKGIGRPGRSPVRQCNAGSCPRASRCRSATRCCASVPARWRWPRRWWAGRRRRPSAPRVPRGISAPGPVGASRHPAG